MSGLSEHADSKSELNTGLYAKSKTAQVYARLASLASGLIEAGFPVIVDATFLLHEQRKPFGDLARRLGVPFHILCFRASADSLQKRIVNRAQQKNDASEADLRVMQYQISTVEPLTPSEAVTGLDIDTDHPPDPDWLTQQIRKVQKPH